MHTCIRFENYLPENLKINIWPYGHTCAHYFYLLRVALHIMQDENKHLIRIGENIRMKRNEKGLSLQELADNSEIDKSTIHRMEKGKYNVKILTLIAIAETLGIDVGELTK